MRAIAALLLVAGTARAAETTPVWRPPSERAGLGWDLLRLPERVVVVAATPLLLAIGGVERTRLDRRLYDLVTNDDRTVFLLPAVTYGSTEGFGGGATFRHVDLFGNDENLSVQGLVWTNLDWRARATFDGDVLALDDRRLRLSASALDDRNERWYGLGGDTDEGDERGLRQRVFGARASLGLVPGHAPLTAVVLEAGWRRIRYETGDIPGVPGVGERPDDDVAPPPGFGRATDFPEAALRLRWDSRDSDGRPTRGMRHELAGTFTADTDGAAQSAVAGRGSLAFYAPVAPGARVLVLGLAAGATAPLRPNDEVPAHALFTLGRDQGLRGYPDGRFRGRYGWVGSVEYRYPFWTLGGSGTTTSAALFAETGRVGDEPGELVEGPLRWSAGFGLRVETATSLLVGAQLGFSPEGLQVVGGLGIAP